VWCVGLGWWAFGRFWAFLVGVEGWWGLAFACARLCLGVEVMVLSMAGIGLCARPSTGLRMTAARGFGLVLRYGVEVWWGLAFARVL
jgi:hypothetical protein